jgi:D-alanyl-D-alanine carboxypeptidase
MRQDQHPRRQAGTYRKKKARQQDPLKVLLIVLLLACFILLGIYLLKNNSPAPGGESESTTAQTQPPRTGPSTTEAPTESSAPQTESATHAPTTAAPQTTEAPADESWKLVLVNADHPLPEGFTVQLKALRNGHHVDERIYPELQQMFDDARAAGIYPLINESFRTGERQQEIMDKYIAGYEAQGMSHDEAVKKAHTVVAEPGTSEHQLGLALDIIAEFDADSTATWNWLKDNAWRYGFILRYPADKVDLTGIDYEPWHYRYVGKEAAKEITERGICLEEYLADAD